MTWTDVAGAFLGGLILVAAIALIFGSGTGPQTIGAIGNAFGTMISSAMGKGSLH